MIPVLVTPPASHPITIDEAKLHCRIDHNDDDTLIEAYIGAAVGHLDGWTGILGRCIMPQTWLISACAGDVILPMPDVTTASGAYAAGATALTVTATALGPCVSISEDCDVTFSCAMPTGLIATARAAVLLLVGHWYAHREAVGDPFAETPLTVDALVTQMRWRRI